eukprot:gnl/MRDRNA2_/MRDRNA2_83185_c0_seq1.p1 gnl/MRDRNA2_/MRDRNA2_83185_c0~~gnl/MRDRNA2_/MRDRNA2_83185_c0_seq1.p1  ORF type:complete len:257 (+),score=27.37 gnl/MRDRNA2_/MRDRNA2_83185_c0_seq1:119-889(+)
MSAIRMFPRNLFADRNDVWETHVHVPFVDGSKRNDSSGNVKGIENCSEKQSPSHASSESTTDYEGSTQCDTTSNPDLDYIDEQQKAEEKDHLDTQLSCLAHSFGKYAHCAEDVYVMMRFAQLTKIPRITKGYAKMVLRTLKMLHLCKYPASDIWIIMAHASVYFEDVCKAVGAAMNEEERNNIIVPTVFLAHSHILDETCPLKVWHKHLLGSYCSLKILNAAVLELFKQRGYILRLDDMDLAERLACITPITCSLN